MGGAQLAEPTMFLRMIAAASLAFIAALMPARAADQAKAGFGVISATLNATLTDTGAPGDALFIGDGDAIFYVESAGKADFSTPIRVSPKSDVAELMTVLSLVDSGLIKLDDPARNYLKLAKSDPFAKSSIRALITARTSGGKAALEAAKKLVWVAESATAQPWNSLFNQSIGKPLALSGTSYPQPGSLSKALGVHNPAEVLVTNTRDYARLLSVLANHGTQTGAQLLTRNSVSLLFNPQLIGNNSCTRVDESGECALIEQDAVGLYAWVDRARGLYGVFAAPGAEISLAKPGRAIRAQAETIIEREHAASGVTAAIKDRGHSTGK